MDAMELPANFGWSYAIAPYPCLRIAPASGAIRRGVKSPLPVCHSQRDLLSRFAENTHTNRHFSRRLM